jgi:RNA polymerase sigma-70 factor (ECF subfamily)
VSDRQVVDAVLAGDRDAYRLLVERESRAVIGLCTSILRDPDEAQDVAQDAFVQAYRSLAAYRADGTFGAWIGRIATRMALARAAAVKRGAAPVLIQELVERGPTDESANPERDVVRQEQALAIQRAIGDLPAEQRQVVALRFYQDLPLEAIADTLGLPLGTVKSRLHRALARMRDLPDLRSVS